MNIVENFQQYRLTYDWYKRFSSDADRLIQLCIDSEKGGQPESTLWQIRVGRDAAMSQAEDLLAQLQEFESRCTVAPHPDSEQDSDSNLNTQI